ncbi:Uncharacterised protein [Candidatus Gugararchaeum adminiculabundum]|nr:Uncharacterised protein [Candidatus Gugararchaeum adminiculabundum]
MGYDIPDQVKYKEKIVFNLDAHQLICALLFGGGAVIAYGLPVQGELKLIAPGVIVLIGIGFVFLRLENMILIRVAFFNETRFRSFVRWVLRKALRKNIDANKEFKERVIQVKGIERRTFILGNEEIRAVLRITPLNFALFDDDRKKSLISNYREFLNHLTYPVEMVIRTTSVGLGDYYTAYEKGAKGLANESFNELYQDFKKTETAFLEKNDTKERGYFLVISFWTNSKDLEESFGKLDERVEIVKEKLCDCGIVGERLKGEKLFPFIVSYFIAEEKRGEKDGGKQKPAGGGKNAGTEGAGGKGEGSKGGQGGAGKPEGARTKNNRVEPNGHKDQRHVPQHPKGERLPAAG